jgi:hypothetical protein
MIHGGYGPIRAAHTQPASAQAREGLRAGNLMNQMEIDVEYGRTVRFGGDDMGIPDLGEKGFHFDTIAKAITKTKAKD